MQVVPEETVSAPRWVRVIVFVHTWLTATLADTVPGWANGSSVMCTALFVYVPGRAPVATVTPYASVVGSKLGPS